MENNDSIDLFLHTFFFNLLPLIMLSAPNCIFFISSLKMSIYVRLVFYIHFLNPLCRETMSCSISDF